jgi:hypothetical protein
MIHVFSCNSFMNLSNHTIDSSEPNQDSNENEGGEMPKDSWEMPEYFSQGKSDNFLHSCCVWWTRCVYIYAALGSKFD